MLKGWCIEFVLFIIWFGNLVATNIVYLLLEITPLIFSLILFWVKQSSISLDFLRKVTFNFKQKFWKHFNLGKYIGG